MIREKEQRIKRYQESSEAIQGLYSSPETGATLRQIFDAHHIPEDSYKVFAQTVGDVILGLYSKNSLAQLLRQALGTYSVQSEQIAQELQALLIPVPETTVPKTNHVIQSDQTLQDASLIEPTHELSTSIDTDYAKQDRQNAGLRQETTLPQKEDLTTQLERLRTMQNDADRVHGYGAYRSKYEEPDPSGANVNKRDPLADLPKYTNGGDRD